MRNDLTGADATFQESIPVYESTTDERSGRPRSTMKKKVEIDLEYHPLYRKGAPSWTIFEIILTSVGKVTNK